MAQSEINSYSKNRVGKKLSTALAKDHAKGDISMVTELVNLCAIV